MNLLERVIQTRSALPNSQLWELLEEHGRGSCILKILDEDTSKHGDISIYTLYVRAYRVLRGHSLFMSHKFDCDKLLEIFDMMEKYAQNWVFS